MDLTLTDEQAMIREVAHDFADSELAPRARDSDRAEEFDAGVVARLGEMGYIGATVSESFGGAGLDYVDYGLVLEELGRVDSSVRTVISVSTSLVAGTIERWGSEAQKEALLPPLCAGEALGCFGLTEPESGSDAGSIRTTALRDGDGWSISGQKYWISLGVQARFALIFARTGTVEEGHVGLSCFIVPTDLDGWSAERIHGKHGLRAADVASISMDEVRVGPDALLGELGAGWKIAMTTLDSGRFSVAAGCVGICQASLDLAVAYAKEREQFGRPIGSFQLVQKLISQIALDTDAARMLLWRAGAMKDDGQRATVETSMAKLFASEAAVRCAGTALQVHGGAGYVDDLPIERHLRDARVTTLYEGTSQVHELIIGRALTGINAMA